MDKVNRHCTSTGALRRFFLKALYVAFLWRAVELCGMLNEGISFKITVPLCAAKPSFVSYILLMGMYSDKIVQITWQALEMG